jgi:hypothetical protein
MNRPDRIEVHRRRGRIVRTQNHAIDAGGIEQRAIEPLIERLLDPFLFRQEGGVKEPLRMWPIRTIFSTK